MHSLIAFVLLAFLACLALAAPTENPAINKRSFTVPRFRANSLRRSPVDDRAYVLAKHATKSQSVSTVSTVSTDELVPADLVDASASAYHHHKHHLTAPTGSAGTFPNATAPAVPSSNSSVSGASISYTVDAQTDVTRPSSAASSDASSTASAKHVEASVAVTAGTGNSYYYSSVVIGGQKLYMNFDTGSSDLWVFSTDLPASSQGNHTLFDSSKSSTWRALDGYSWQITYGDDTSASGKVGKDKVVIGAATVTAQAVELAATVAPKFVDQVFDGLLGLAFSGGNMVSPQAQKTFLDNIKDNLAQPVFTTSLDANGVGEYEFGTIDSAKYKGDIHYASVDNSQALWMLESTSYQIKGETGQTPDNLATIADTGTSLVLVAGSTTAAYYKTVTGASYSSDDDMWLVPCALNDAGDLGTNTDLPSFGMAIGSSGYYATISGNAIVYEVADVVDGSQMCYGSIQSNGGQGLQIMGDTLLTEQYVVFDISVPRIGFANRLS